MEEIPKDKELEVGITTFLHSFSPITATYKYRYSDFVVEEITLDKVILNHDPNAIKSNLSQSRPQSLLPQISP